MNSFIQCLICKNKLAEPVILPCGHTVCKEHTVNSSSKCPKCQKSYQVPKKGYISNKLAENLLENNNLEELEIGLEHTMVIDSWENLKELLSDYERIRADPGFEINRVLDELRNKIDLRREEAKKKIDDEALELIKQLDEYEKKRKAVFESKASIVLDKNEDLVNLVKSELVCWENDLFSFEKKIKKWKQINEEIVLKCMKLKTEFDRFNQRLFTDEFNRLKVKQAKFCEEQTQSLL